ncbi:hypothetical protein [Nonomuraea antri]|uniref:hypothetical protein n=1 Tax=Nonomuraea antri TaxID=2730852 RepID=UPI001569F7CD|nr:hypothetical protein [Nonomuraea antri]
MVTSGDGSGVAHRTGPAGWVFRAVVSAHTVAIAAQPVFAGVYLTGDFDSLRRHAIGADVTTSIGYLQLIVAIVLWVRLRRAWPFLATAGVVAAENVQYFAGLDGALWLHVPLGVMSVAAVVVQFISVWRRPLTPVPARRNGHVRLEVLDA